METQLSLEEPLSGRHSYDWKQKPPIFQGPKKVLRLLLLCIIIPGLLVAVPMYLKHRVYDYTIYPIAMSDMRLIDNRISTTWCQKQLVQANATFNAFLMSDSPHVAHERVPISMTRHLKLTDDMKEYWGFYLLKGSTVTVSTCVRWPGASLILIRGHRHLHECAYIGDDSSEEIEELMEIAAEKGLIDYVPEVSSDDAPTNTMNLLTKYRQGVTFHDPTERRKAETYTFKHKDPTTDTDENRNAKQMKELLGLLAYKNEVGKAKNAKYYKTNEQLMNTLREKIADSHKEHPHVIRELAIGKQEDSNLKFGRATNTSVKNETSLEELQHILDRLKKLGGRGDRILNLLKKQLLADKKSTEIPKMKITNRPADTNTNFIENVNKKSDAKSDATSKLATTTSMPKDIESTIDQSREQRLLREKRNLIIKTALYNELNDGEDEKDNVAIEEGFVPDGIADHHHVLNQTQLNDRSNSEFWSSFSSSEEALLNCAGLILSLPLTPNKLCGAHRTESEISKASFANTITYSVPTNGYYFFVFNSENEVQENYIQVKFDLQKTMYNVSNPVSMCGNSTKQCEFALNFFSNEKVVFEFPVKGNDSLWNEEFTVMSECVPRTSVYLVCVLSVPLIILLFAFQ